MNDILIKYNSLSPDVQKEVNDFLDFMLTKKGKKMFDMKRWKKKIRNVSTWTDEDSRRADNRLVNGRQKNGSGYRNIY